MYIFPYNGKFYGTICLANGKHIDDSNESFSALFKSLLIKAGVK